MYEPEEDDVHPNQVEMFIRDAYLDGPFLTN
jgi:hypothetical protein